MLPSIRNTDTVLTAAVCNCTWPRLYCASPPITSSSSHNTPHPQRSKQHMHNITTQTVRAAQLESELDLLSDPVVRCDCTALHCNFVTNQPRFLAPKLRAYRTLSGRRGAKQLVVVTTHKTFSAPHLSTAALTPSTSVTTASPCVTANGNECICSAVS